MINQQKTLFFSALALFLCAAPARAEENMMDMMMDMPDVKAYGTITIGSYLTKQDEIIFIGADLGADGAPGGTGDDADSDVAIGYDDLAVKSDGEIGLKASETLYNGMVLDARVQFDLDLELDEYELSLQTGVGHFRLGSADTAAEALHVTLPVFSPGGGATGVDSPDLFPLSRTSARDSTYLELDSDANHFAYFSPRFFGIALGASFTPDGGDVGQAGQRDLSEDGSGDESIISLGAHYQRSFGRMDFSGSFGYLTGETDGPDDMQLMTLGAQISRGNFTLGGAWLQGDDVETSGDEHLVWTAGLAYERGDWTYGIGYRVSEKDFSIGTDAHSAENTAIQLGAMGDMGNGLSVGLDIQRVEDTDSSQDTESLDSYFGGFVVSLSF